MKTIWLASIKHEDAKQDIANAFAHGGVLRGRLKEILEAKVSAEITEMTSKKGYESPNWAYKQAGSVDYIRALNEVISLLE